MQEGHGSVGGEDRVHCGEVRGGRRVGRGEEDEGSAQSCGRGYGAEDDQGNPGQTASLCCLKGFGRHIITSPRKVRKCWQGRFPAVILFLAARWSF